MVSRPAVPWLAWLGRGVVAFGAMLFIAFVTASVARACSGPGIPFERVVAHPGMIALVRVLDIAGDPQAPDRYQFAVDEVWRGAVPPVFDIEPPLIHGCGDRLAVNRGDRLVLALDVNAFDAAKPMAAFWVMDAAGRIDGTLVEERPGVSTLAALRAVLAPTGAVLPDDQPGAPGTSEDAGVPLVVALLAIASCVLGGALLVAALARRRHRDESG